MNVGIRTVATQFLSLEYLFRIFGIFCIFAVRGCAWNYVYFYNVFSLNFVTLKTKLTNNKILVFVNYL
jgi:hypothetical protein